MNKETLPNFLIVGAAKAGTTSLYRYLEQHPDVFMSAVKEPCFFCYADEKPNYKVGKNAIFDYDKYIPLFEGSEGYKARGEATAIYLYMYEDVIRNIKKYIPDYQNLKIIIVLRNPADRAYSQYMMNVRDLRENLSFEEAIDQEQKRMKEDINTDFYYLDRGFYYNQVKAFLNNFPNVKIFLFEELASDPKAVMKDVCEFLEIDPEFEFKLGEKYNISGRPRYAFLSTMLRKKFYFKSLIKKVIPAGKRKKVFSSVQNFIYSFNLKKERVNVHTKKRLTELYKKDIMCLQELINKDLRKWMN